MSLWRLEWLRLVRTPRAIALAAVFLFVGMIEPVLTRYERDLIGRLSHGAHIAVAAPTAADGLNSYVTEISLIGLIVVVAIAAGAFCFDVRHGLATFLRTRTSSMWQLMIPRFTACAAAAAAAYLLGTLGAWYETSVLIGSLPVPAVLGGIVCGVVYLTFAVAVTALAASLARTVVGTIAIALAILVLIPIAGAFHVIDAWLPGALVNGPAELITGTGLAHFAPALGTAVVASIVAVAVAVIRLRAREI
jgi:ABC-2 type transport system permease protein